MGVPSATASPAAVAGEETSPAEAVPVPTRAASIVVPGLDWKAYQAIDQALAGRHAVRLRYLDGDLEIMPVSDQHERLKWALDRLVTEFLETSGTTFYANGNTTMAEEGRRTGREPDASFLLHEENKTRPDLAIEVALTSGGVDKLEHYRRFGVPEVWIWRHDALEVYALNDGEPAGYRRVPRSLLLPGLDLDLVNRCARLPASSEVIREFRRGQPPG